MGVFGEISELEHRIYFNTLQESLSINYSLVSQKLFEQAQEQAFNELDFEECTEEQCFALIQELLQVENLFLFQIVREGTFNQLTLTHIDLDNQRTVRTAFCEDCGIGQINRQIDDLVRKIMKATPDASLAGTPIRPTPKQEPQPEQTPEPVKEAELQPVREVEPEPVKEAEPEPQTVVTEAPVKAPSETVVASERDMTWHYVTLGIAGVALLQSLSNANQFNALASKNQELANSYASSSSAATKSEYQSNQSKMKSYKSQVQLWDMITLLALGVEAYLWFSESPDTMASRFSPRVLAFSSPQTPRGFNLKWQWQF